MIPWGREKRLATNEPQTPAPVAGASFGPWATHESRCKCNVCR